MEDGNPAANARTQLQEALQDLEGNPLPPHANVLSLQAHIGRLSAVMLAQANIIMAPVQQPAVGAHIASVASARVAQAQTYDGKREIRDWTTHMEDYFNVTGIPDDKKVQFARLHLVPKVLTQWNIRAKSLSVIPIGQPGYTDVNDWGVFKEALVKMYGLHDPSEKARKTLNRLTQGKQSAEEFQKKFSSTASLITENALSSNDLAGRFWDALDPELKILMKAANQGKRPTELNQLYELAVLLDPDLEELRKAKSDEGKSKSKSTSFGDQGSSQTQEKKRKPEGDGPPRFAHKKKKFSRLAVATNGQPPMDPEKMKKLKDGNLCYICELPGHRAFKCPKKKGNGHNGISSKAAKPLN
jgi:hypothetical protein